MLWLRDLHHMLLPHTFTHAPSQSFHNNNFVWCSDAAAELKNDDGKTPLEVAQLNDQEAVVQLLQKASKPKEANGKSSAKESKQDVYL